VSETFTPLTPEELAKAQPNLRLMKIIVTVLGALIMLAFLALIVGFVMRLNGRAPGSSNPVASVYSLPAHSRITSMQIAGGSRIVLTVSTPDGDEIDIFDTDTGRLVSKIEIPSAR
jgi:hypothetical protein